ncbi:hypothetical protein TPA0909_00200 [Streptomyces albus]|nr:hypothetical protein TPA0909_00200 [Streptomyces albus]
MVLVVVVLPILWTVLLSFRRARLVDIPHMGLFGDWSLANFAGVFSSSDFWTSLWTTLLYTVGGTAGSLVLGLVAALALRRPFRGRGLLRGAMLLPYVAPVVAVTFVWQIALSPQFGIVNEWGAHAAGLGRSDRLPVHPRLGGERMGAALRCPARPADRHRLRDVALLPVRLSSSCSPGSRRCPPCWRRPRWWTGPPPPSVSAMCCCRS